MRRFSSLVRRYVTSMLTKRQRNNWGALLDLDDWFGTWQQEVKQLKQLETMNKYVQQMHTKTGTKWADLVAKTSHLNRLPADQIDTSALINDDFSINCLPALKIIVDTFDMMQKNPAFRNWTDSEWLLGLTGEPQIFVVSVGHPSWKKLAVWTMLTQYQSVMRKKQVTKVRSEQIIQDEVMLDRLTRYVRICDSVYASSIARFCKEAKLSPDCIVNSQEGSVFSPKHVLLVLHDTKEIMLVVRGSASLLDLCTDFALLTVPFKHGHGHGGIVHAANWLMRKTQDELVRLAVIYPDYSVVFTGHSLGGGVAALAAMEMRNVLPNVQCVAFASPACVTLEIAKECKDFVTTVVNGDDVVPRFHPFSLLQLQKEVASFHWRTKLKELIDDQVARQLDRVVTISEEINSRIEKQMDHVTHGLKNKLDEWSLDSKTWWDRQSNAPHGKWKRKQPQVVSPLHAVWSPSCASSHGNVSSMAAVTTAPPMPQVVTPAPVPAKFINVVGIKCNNDKRLPVSNHDATLSQDELNKMKWFPPGKIIVLQDTEPKCTTQMVQRPNAEFGHLVLSNAMLINHLCTEYEKALQRAQIDRKSCRNSKLM